MEFIGKLHPLFVHLPIGILLIGVVFIWLNESERAIKISLIVGALAAVASVVTGLLLTESEGYGDDVTYHKWAGIVLMITSVALCWTPQKFLKPGSIVITVLVFVTGHLGGTLTHGPLLAEVETDNTDNLDLTKIDFNNAIVYDDAVKPILEARCYSCHGEQKQKGRLRLDSPEDISRGGKNGKIIVPGNPEESEIVKRIDLPLDDEDHMPPKEKKQLTDQERKLISLWVSDGADFHKKFSQQEISQLTVISQSAMLPDVEVPGPDEELVSRLIEQSVGITHVARGSNFLEVNFVSIPHETQKLLETLKPIARNIVSLKLNSTDVKSIIIFENLLSLSLADTQVTDEIIDQIIECKHLVNLNISGTKITSIDKLKSLKNLKYLNIYNTGITNADLPGVKIEKGNYNVPTLETDTTFVKIN